MCGLGGSEMDPILKAKWIAALRSGKYVQGKGYLHKITKGKEHMFCCLGVLCEVAEFPKDEPKVPGVFVSYGGTLGGLSSGTLHMVGLDLDDQDTLIDLNDGNGEENDPLPFSQIADWIEEFL